MLVHKKGDFEFCAAVGTGYENRLFYIGEIELKTRRSLDVTEYTLVTVLAICFFINETAS